MKITRDATLLLILIFLFVLLAIEVGTLNVDYTVMAPNGHTTIDMPPSSQVVYGDYSWIFIGVFYGIIVSGIIGALLIRKRLKGHMLDDIISEIIGTVITIGIIMGLIFGLNKVTISSSENSVKPVGGVPVSAVVFYVSLIFLMGILFYAIIRNIKRKEKEVIVESKEAKKYVEQAIYTVQLGEDVRSAILRAYKELENMIHALRQSEKNHYTPREFENFIVENFEVSSAPVKKLVALFEAARYSPHEMSEAQREEAIAALEAVKRELS